VFVLDLLISLVTNATVWLDYRLLSSNKQVYYKREKL